MKFLIMFAAWAVSAVLVLPTVSQAQGENIHRQAPAAAIAADAWEQGA